jgi:hypothetical protein
MTLEGLFDGHDVSAGIYIYIIPLLMPRAVGIIDRQVTLVGRRRALLKSVGSVGNGDSETVGSGDSKEEAHAGLLNTRGICFRELT